ncbi:chemotaxis protein CheW [bacterium]|nr:chemotaxis protein CheW [bacterium]
METRDVNSDKMLDAEIDDEETTEDTQRDKYLTFRLEPEEYGVSIKYVIEIIVLQSITEVPDTPAFVNGVINLRGRVIPVIDVRRRFGLDTREYDERTCIVVVDIDGIAVGLIVDTVNEVVDIPGDQVDPAPRTHSGVESSYIQGMGKIGKKVIILLDVEKVTHIERKTSKNDET